MNRAEVTDIDHVLVIGCGMIGIGAIVRASLRGATVIAVDLDDEKLALAKRMGAAYVINSKTDDLHARLLEITEGLGPDVVIEAVGSPITQNQAVSEVAFCGRIVFIGGGGVAFFVGVGGCWRHIRIVRLRNGGHRHQQGEKGGDELSYSHYLSF